MISYNKKVEYNGNVFIGLILKKANLWCIENDITAKLDHGNAWFIDNDSAAKFTTHWLNLPDKLWYNNDLTNWLRKNIDGEYYYNTWTLFVKNETDSTLIHMTWDISPPIIQELNYPLYN